jgi:DNA polymerase III sliding clamp (beta) subunit (PCNA family)
MMTIGEFARRTGLSVSALRFYANQGLLVPAQVDSGSGYRFYDHAQVPDGSLIRDLRRLDMPLAEITQALQLSNAERKELVAQHLRRLERVVERARSITHSMNRNPTTKEDHMPTTTLQALDLADAFDQVLPAAGTDPEVPHLMGVLVEGREGSIRLVATDRHRLAIRDLVPSTLTEEFSAVIPAAALSRWRQSLTEATELSISLDERDMTAAGAGVDLTALMVPTAFPDYERFLEPSPGATTILADRGSLLTAIQAFAQTDAAIEIATSENEIRIARDEQKLDVSASIDGPAQRVGLNPQYVADAIGHAVGAELTIEISTQQAPVVFRSADDGTHVSLIMPFKLA